MNEIEQHFEQMVEDAAKVLERAALEMRATLRTTHEVTPVKKAAAVTQIIHRKLGEMELHELILEAHRAERQG